MSRMDQLPGDVKAVIVSQLSLAEAARSSLLSRAWKDMWHSVPRLNFDASTVIPTTGGCKNIIDRSGDWYKSWVDTVLNNRIERRGGSGRVRELRMHYELEKTHEYEIDKWIQFAMAQQVEALHIELQGYWRSWVPESLQCGFSEHALSSKLASLSSLRSLNLKYVKVTKRFIELVLSNCSHLEYLSLDHTGGLRNLEVNAGASNQLKQFRIVTFEKNANALVALSAPNLTSFNYSGNILNPRNVHVPKLVDLAVCGVEGQPVLSYLHPFLSQLPQLESLELASREMRRLNLDHIPQMVKLKCFTIVGFPRDFDASGSDFVGLFKMCPNLQTLTLKKKYGGFDYVEGRLQPHRPLGETCRHTFNGLKVLQLHGRRTNTLMDLRLTEFIIENSPNLEKLIINTAPIFEVAALAPQPSPWVVRMAENNIIEKIRPKFHSRVNLMIT